MRRLLSKRALIVFALIAVMVPVTAWAHQGFNFHGSDYAEMGPNHDTIWACDGESDGNGVRAHTRNAVGNIDAWDWDTDGAGGGCARNNIPNEEIEYRICENNVGCSDWKFE
jgi:hypothetical protein